MGIINPAQPQPNQARGDQEAVLDTLLSTLLNEFNGNVDEANLKAAVKDKLGLSDGTTARRGKSIIATPETRTNVAYGTLATPDQVTVTLPQDGRIVLAYQALWQESVVGAARAAIFLGANQLEVQANTLGANGPVTEAAPGPGGTANLYAPLFSCPIGLAGVGNNGTSHADDVTTGQVVGWANLGSSAVAPQAEIGGTIFSLGNNVRGYGGTCEIFAAAGTYIVSVQFKSSSGSVTVKNRKLWVETRGF